jgi:O-antigen ligase
VRWIAFALIGSCMVNVLLTGGQLLVGRGVKLQGVSAQSPLAKAVFHTRTVTKLTPIRDGDTVWQVDGQRVNSPDELAAALVSGSGVAKVRIYRVEWTPELEVPRTLLSGTNAQEQLGITGWSRGRDWRATGFYGHWTTYAEVLQLIASLALGIFLALPQKNSAIGWLLLAGTGGLVFALAMTVTRGSWIGFAVSAAAMLLLTASRRTALIVIGCAIPLVLAGVFLLQQRRNIGVFDSADQSTSWRQMVWQEGFDLLVSNPRHLLVGVGIDSIKGHWREWRLFDNGRQPIGHMHSNILQIALERGVPALIVWLALFAIYVRMLWRLIRQTTDFPRGLALGALGGSLGFFTSGLVHYNWGDSEVVTIFYFIMGLTLVVERSVFAHPQTRSDR